MAQINGVIAQFNIKTNQQNQNKQKNTTLSNGKTTTNVFSKYLYIWLIDYNGNLRNSSI